jgi:hypothetical protein
MLFVQPHLVEKLHIIDTDRTTLENTIEQVLAIDEAPLWRLTFLPNKNPSSLVTLFDKKFSV